MEKCGKRQEENNYASDTVTEEVAKLLSDTWWNEDISKMLAVKSF